MTTMLLEFKSDAKLKLEIIKFCSSLYCSILNIRAFLNGQDCFNNY